MISLPLRDAVNTLHQQGKSLREISRILELSRNTVRRILRPDVNIKDDDPRQIYPTSNNTI
jgi:lambda repressor-like predicted transcriptional regulator